MPPPCEKNGKVVWLIMTALVSLCLIFALTMYENAHDPEWWKHVGIKHDKSNKNKNDDLQQVVLLDDGNMFVAPNRNKKNGVLHPADADSRPLNGRYAESKKLIDLHAIKNATHFIADYDALGTAVPTCPDPSPLTGKRKAFDYIDIVSNNSRWTGKWLSQHPFVAMIPEFLTDQECAEMVAAANKVLFRSQVAPYQNSNMNPVNDVRTSSQAWLNPNFGIQKTVVDRVMQLLSQFDPRSHEELQILKYEKGQKYDSHNDYFDPKFYGAQANNRAVTIFLYLTDVEEGGFTVFPRAGGRPPPMEFKSCDKGLRVRPIKRAIAVFYDMDCYGQLDDTSLHGGCPPVRGTKWGGTLWVRYPYH